MSHQQIARPESGEYDPYFDRYIGLAPEGDIIVQLEAQIGETTRLLDRVPEKRGSFRYAPGKWTLTEVIGHIADTERVFAYRALRFSRNDRTPLPGFEQDDFVAHGAFGTRTLAGVTAELAAVRAATVALFTGLTPAQLVRRGVANNVEMSVRAVPYVLAGHELHHLAIIRQRYLDGSGS
ncbi:MAG: DinB family protein [Gemmatimonadota bacterium]|nr:DinB family protein [Gemmatimonadota bacterium]